MDWKMVTFEKDIDIIGLYSCFYREHTKDFYFPGEQHDFWEMIYVDKGELAATAGNKSYIVKQGEIIFHRPMEFHALTANKKDSVCLLTMAFYVKSAAMSFFEDKIFDLNTKQKNILSLLLEEAKMLYDNLEILLGDQHKNSVLGGEQSLIAYLELFLISLIRYNQNQSKVSRISTFARKNVETALINSIEGYLTDNVYNNITIHDVCKKFNMSESYISHLFKDLTSKSIIDSFIRLKIAEAKKLIRQGDHNFTQIAEKLSYASMQHFSRSFKRVTGMSPSSYMKSVKP